MIDFAHAAWLWTLGALAVPVALHLFARRAAVPVDFPPAVLLEKDTARAARARRLKELLHLVLRLALVACLALCFARPRLPWLAGGAGGSAEGGAEAPVALVLVVDDSPSTSRPSDPVLRDGDTRLDRALAAAREALLSLPSESEASAVFASGRCLGPASPGEIAAELPAAKVSPRARMDRALAAVPEFLAASEPLEPFVMVLSDCEAGSLPEAVLRELAAEAKITVFDAGRAGPGDDWALLGARPDRPRLVAGEEAAVLVRLARAPGDAPEATRRLELILDGVAVAWRDVELAAGAEAEIALPLAISEGTHLGELRLALSETDPWKANDRLPAAFTAAAAPRVAVIARREALSGAGRAVHLALSAGPGRERKAFHAELLAPESAALADFSLFRTFVLVGPPELDGESIARLARTVAAGAGLVILAEDPAALELLAAEFNLPGPPAEREPVVFEPAARLAPAEADELFFRPLGASAGPGGAEVFRRALRLRVDKGRVLAWLRSPGREVPGIVERSLGRGTVLLVASGPGRRFSALAEREQAGFFVPLMHELAARAAGLPGSGLSAGPGEAVKVEIPGRERAASFWLTDDRGLRLPAGHLDAEGRLHFSASREPAAYRLISEHEGRILTSRALSVHLDAGELSGRREPDERIAAFAAAEGAGPAGISGDRSGGFELAGALAVIALALLACEILAGFLTAQPKPPPDAAGPPGPASQKRGRAGAGA